MILTNLINAVGYQTLSRFFGAQLSLKSYNVSEDYKNALISVIKAFKEAETASRLLITCRYDFDLFDENSGEISKLMLKLPLPSMNEREAKKQYFAKYGKLEKEKDKIILKPERVVDACKGNPGLQDILFRLFANAPKSYLNALEGMENYLKSGKLPKEKEILNFLLDLAIDNVLKLLTKHEMDLLQVVALFDIPVFESVFDKISEEIGINNRTDYKKRLIGFGVFEQFEDLVLQGKIAFLLNNIIKPRIAKLPTEAIEHFANIITNNLLKIWCSDKVEYRSWICDREIVKFGLISKNISAIKLCSENCIREMHENFWTKEAANFAVLSISLLEDNKENVSVDLYEIASNVCHQVGDINNAEKYISAAIRLTEENEDTFYKLGKYFAYSGRILIQKGKVAESLEKFEAAKKYFSKAKALRELGVIKGDIARIKVDKGEIDEALKLHQEMIQVFEKLGDTREKAVTLGGIARIKVEKGEIDEALKLHQEMIQVFEKLGDTRSKAVTLGDIARIKVSKGEIDEALKLHQEMIQVFEKLGDDDGRAVTLWDMSKILLQKKETQKAYEFLAESYNINHKLGRLDGICYVGLDLGVLLCQAGQKEDGVKILQTSRDGFEKLGQKELVLQLQEIIKLFK